MDELDRYNYESLFRAFISMMNSFVLHDYGIIDTVTNDPSIVTVMSTQKKLGAIKKYECRYVSINAASFGMDLKPKKGDKVLVISLPHLQSSMLTATEPVEVTNPSGYGIKSMIAIPLGLFDASSKTRLKMDDDNSLTTLETDNDMDILARELHLNGSSNELVKFVDLNTQLQNLITSLNTQLNAIKTAAATAIAGGGYWTTPLTSLGGLSLDISSAKTTTVKSGD